MCINLQPSECLGTCSDVHGHVHSYIHSIQLLCRSSQWLYMWEYAIDSRSTLPHHSCQELPKSVHMTSTQAMSEPVKLLNFVPAPPMYSL